MLTNAIQTNAIPVTFQTNLRKLDPTSDFKLQHVLHCQTNVGHEPDVPLEERIPEPEHKAVRSATMKFIARSSYVLSSINERSFFADPKHQATLKRDLSAQAVLLTIYHVHDKPSDDLVNIDYASACASTGSASNIMFQTPSALQCSSLPDGKQRWCKTQIITSNVPREDLESALQKIALAIDPESNGSTSVYCHGLNMGCQVLQVARLLPSVATDEDFLDPSAGIEIPWVGANKLVSSLMSQPIPPKDSPKARDSDGLMVVPGSSTSLYLNGAPQVFIAEKPHIYVTPDPNHDTLDKLLFEQLKRTQSPEGRTAKLDQLRAMLKGLRVRLSNSRDETHVASEMCYINPQSAPSHQRHDAWPAKGEKGSHSDRPCFNVGSKDFPVLLPAELCIPVPNQDLRSGRSPYLARLIENMRHADIPTTTTATVPLSGWSIARHQSMEKINNLQEVFKEFGGTLPTVLFLEARTGPKDKPSPNWDLVRQTLKENMQRLSQQALEKDIPCLSLRYDESIDVQALWTQQIRQFVLKHRTLRQRMLLMSLHHRRCRSPARHLQCLRFLPSPKHDTHHSRWTTPRRTVVTTTQRLHLTAQRLRPKLTCWVASGWMTTSSFTTPSGPFLHTSRSWL